MRLTVGQLPPSVYWRRRAVVAAAVLVVVLFVAYSCSGGDEPEKKPTGNPTTNSTGEPASTQSSTPQPPVITPNASEPSSGLPINGNQGGAAGAGVTGDTCADSELLVTAAAERTSVRQGAPVMLYIRIKNTSNRVCSRDLGAQAQELYLEHSSAKAWSSDDCTNNTSSAGVRQLSPGIVYEFNVSWNGQGTAQGCTNRQNLAQGSYQLRARLERIISEPVTVTVTA